MKIMHVRSEKKPCRNKDILVVTAEEMRQIAKKAEASMWTDFDLRRRFPTAIRGHIDTVLDPFANTVRLTLTVQIGGYFHTASRTYVKDGEDKQKAIYFEQCFREIERSVKSRPASL